MSIPTGAQAMEMGTRIVQSIGNRAYGLRDFTLSDPDGFGVRFASLLDAVSNREVGAPVASSRRKRSRNQAQGKHAGYEGGWGMTQLRALRELIKARESDVR